MSRLRIPAFLRYTKRQGKGPHGRGPRNCMEGGFMIYVNQEQLDQVKYLLEQSAVGNHLLFDDKTIHRIALRIGQQESRDERQEKAEQLLEQMILRPTLSSKRAFLEGLDQQTYEDVARIYFNIVQNSAQEKQAFSH